MDKLGKGKLIVFEGGEFSGKSAQIDLLFHYLKERIPVIVSKEPGGTDLTKEIRHILLTQDLSPEEELGWFLKDRKIHFHTKVTPLLKKGIWVLCDRSSPSTIAYQHYGRGLDLSDIRKRDRIVRNNTDFDLVILLDLDPREAFKRAKAETRFEKENWDFHDRVRQGYLNQAKEDPDGWLVVDALQSLEVIFLQIVKEIQKRFF